MRTHILKTISAYLLPAALLLGSSSLAYANGPDAAPHAQVQAPAAAGKAAVKGPKVVDAKGAAKMAGKRVFYGTLGSTPAPIANEIRAHAETQEGQTHGFYMASMLPKSHFEPSDKYHHNLFFVSAGSREAASSGTATRHRDNLFSLAQRIEKGEFEFDTVVVRVSKPNKDGLVSMGLTGDLTMSAVKQVLARGGKVIAEVNPNVPFTHGKNTIAYNDLSAVVESDEPLPALAEAPAGHVEGDIAKAIAGLIPNSRRHTLQVGIGAALSDIGNALQDKKLKIWSEMGSDWMIPTVAREHKPAAREAVVSFLHGSSLLAEVAHDNPAIKVDSSLRINDPKIIAQQKRMVAVNTALQVDITGNTNGEEVEGRIISAPGGQPNFMEGASIAEDGKGKAILALRSLDKYGRSTIIPSLEGKTITTPKQHVDHIVTEWGASRKLRGLSDNDRRYEVLLVTHPFHRPAMAKEALAKGAINQKQHDKLVRSVYWSLLRTHPGTRKELGDAALKAGLIDQDQHKSIIESIPEGTPAALVVIPEIKPAAK